MCSLSISWTIGRSVAISVGTGEEGSASVADVEGLRWADARLFISYHNILVERMWQSLTRGFQERDNV